MSTMQGSGQNSHRDLLGPSEGTESQRTNHNIKSITAEAHSAFIAPLVLRLLTPLAKLEFHHWEILVNFVTDVSRYLCSPLRETLGGTCDDIPDLPAELLEYLLVEFLDSDADESVETSLRHACSSCTYEKYGFSSQYGASPQYGSGPQPDTSPHLDSNATKGAEDAKCSDKPDSGLPASWYQMYREGLYMGRVMINHYLPEWTGSPKSGLCPGAKSPSREKKSHSSHSLINFLVSILFSVPVVSFLLHITENLKKSRVVDSVPLAPSEGTPDRNSSAGRVRRSASYDEHSSDKVANSLKIATPSQPIGNFRSRIVDAVTEAWRSCGRQFLWLATNLIERFFCPFSPSPSFFRLTPSDEWSHIPGLKIEGGSLTRQLFETIALPFEVPLNLVTSSLFHFHSHYLLHHTSSGLSSRSPSAFLGLMLGGAPPLSIPTLSTSEAKREKETDVKCLDKPLYSSVNAAAVISRSSPGASPQEHSAISALSLRQSSPPISSTAQPPLPPAASPTAESPPPSAIPPIPPTSRGARVPKSPREYGGGSALLNGNYYDGVMMQHTVLDPMNVLPKMPRRDSTKSHSSLHKESACLVGEGELAPISNGHPPSVPTVETPPNGIIPAKNRDEFRNSLRDNRGTENHADSHSFNRISPATSDNVEASKHVNLERKETKQEENSSTPLTPQQLGQNRCPVPSLSSCFFISVREIIIGLIPEAVLTYSPMLVCNLLSRHIKRPHTQHDIAFDNLRLLATCIRKVLEVTVLKSSEEKDFPISHNGSCTRCGHPKSTGEKGSPRENEQIYTCKCQGSTPHVSLNDSDEGGKDGKPSFSADSEQQTPPFPNQNSEPKSDTFAQQSTLLRIVKKMLGELHFKDLEGEAERINYKVFNIEVKSFDISSCRVLLQSVGKSYKPPVNSPSATTHDELLLDDPFHKSESNSPALAAIWSPVLARYPQAEEGERSTLLGNDSLGGDISGQGGPPGRGGHFYDNGGTWYDTKVSSLGREEDLHARRDRGAFSKNTDDIPKINNFGNRADEHCSEGNLTSKGKQVSEKGNHSHRAKGPLSDTSYPSAKSSIGGNDRCILFSLRSPQLDGTSAENPNLLAKPIQNKEASCPVSPVFSPPFFLAGAKKNLDSNHKRRHSTARASTHCGPYLVPKSSTHCRLGTEFINAQLSHQWAAAIKGLLGIQLEGASAVEARDVKVTLLLSLSIDKGLTLHSVNVKVSEIRISLTCASTLSQFLLNRLLSIFQNLLRGQIEKSLESSFKTIAQKNCSTWNDVFWTRVRSLVSEKLLSEFIGFLEFSMPHEGLFV